jgi:hypothetical protein
MITAYPTLVGKVVKEVTLSDEEDQMFIAMEFDDGTRVSFRLKSTITCFNPEIANVKNGDLKKIRKLPSRRVAA